MEANENIEDIKANIKADFESGMKYDDISTKYGIAKSTISKYKKNGEWKREKKSVNKAVKKREQNKKVHTKVHDVKLSNSQSTDDKWKEFCFLFLKYHNATQAYAKVYDCNYTSAMVNGSRLLRSDKVNNYIEELRNAHSIENHADVNTVIRFYLSVLGADIKDYIEMRSHPFTRLDDDDKEVHDDNGNVVVDYYNTFSLKEPDKQDWSVIKSVHQGKDGLVLEPYDKMKAAKELINLLPQGKTSKQTDPVVQAIQKSAKTGKEDIDESKIDE